MKKLRYLSSNYVNYKWVKIAFLKKILYVIRNLSLTTCYNTHVIKASLIYNIIWNVRPSLYRNNFMVTI